MSSQPIPGTRGRPILGMIPEMMSDMLGMFMDLTRKHGGIVQFKLFGRPYILVTDPDYVKHILQDQYDHFIRRWSVETGRVLLGNRLSLTDGDSWLRQRRLTQPAFHRQRLLGLVQNPSRRAPLMSIFRLAKDRIFVLGIRSP